MEEKTRIEGYMGRWVSFDLKCSVCVAGKVSRIDGKYVVLNPFEGGEWGDERGLVKKLIDGEKSVKITSIEVITPTTKENVEKYIKYYNKKTGAVKDSQVIGFRRG